MNQYACARAYVGVASGLFKIGISSVQTMREERKVWRYSVLSSLTVERKWRKFSETTPRPRLFTPPIFLWILITPDTLAFSMQVGQVESSINSEHNYHRIKYCLLNPITISMITSISVFCEKEKYTIISICQNTRVNEISNYTTALKCKTLGVVLRFRLCVQHVVLCSYTAHACTMPCSP